MLGVAVLSSQRERECVLVQDKEGLVEKVLEL